MLESIIALCLFVICFTAVYIVFRDPPWDIPNDYPEQDDTFGT